MIAPSESIGGSFMKYMELAVRALAPALSWKASAWPKNCHRDSRRDLSVACVINTKYLNVWYLEECERLKGLPGKEYVG